MKLYQKVVYQLVPTDSNLPEYNGYYSILDTITDEKKIKEYEKIVENNEYNYFTGAYISKSKGFFNFDYKYYKTE